MSCRPRHSRRLHSRCRYMSMPAPRTIGTRRTESFTRFDPSLPATNAKAFAQGSWRSEAIQSLSLDRFVFARNDGYRVAYLLRGELDLGRGRANVGIDLGFELGEVLLEHADQRARGLVEFGLVLPGIHRVENFARHARQ